MAWEKEMITVTFATVTDLSAKQYYFVKKTAGIIAVCAAATDIPFGVLQNKPNGTAALPQSATVCVLGITKVNGDAALAEGAWIGTSADGQADAKTLGTDATEFICGRMITATTAAGGIGTAMINCFTPHNAVTAN